MSAVTFDVRPDSNAPVGLRVQPGPGVVWKALASSMVVPGRRRSVKVAGASGKYGRWAVPLPVRVPQRPAAALLFDHDGRAHWLGIDLDPAGAEQQATEGAGVAVAELLKQAGFHPIMDRSPRGGVHVWAKLPRPETSEFLGPLLRALKRWLGTHHPGVRFDLAPMFNVKAGCLSLPGSPCHGGGYRQLVTPLPVAVRALETPSGVGSVARLAAALNVVLGELPLDSPLISADLSDDEPPLAGEPRPLKKAALDYLTHGYLSDYAGRSEARRAAILHVIWQRWSFTALREKVESGEFQGLANDVNRRGKGGLRYLRQEWNRAVEAIRQRPIHSDAKSLYDDFRQSAHTHEYLHGGALDQGVGPTHWTHRWLQVAEAWATGRYCGTRFLTVVAVLHGVAWLALLQSDGEAGRLRVAELPVRSLRLVTGLIGIETVADVLRELNETAGSPLLLVESGAGTARGSRYYLNQVAPAAEHGQRVQLGALDPVWAVLGLASWRVYSVLERVGRSTASELVNLSGLGKSAVYEAVRVLREHGLVADREVAIGPVTPGQAGRAVGADQIYAEALRRVRVEREQWKRLLASWQDAATVRLIVPEDGDDPRETVDVDDAVVMERLGPVPWEHILSGEPDDDPYACVSVEDHVLSILEDMLGAVRVAPREPVEASVPDVIERWRPSVR